MAASLVYQISTLCLKPFLSTVIEIVENRTHTHERQLEITFLDVLDYSKYCYANISDVLFSTII